MDFDLISIFALVISMSSLGIQYRLIQRTLGDSIIHEMRNLPPYRSDDNFSTIIVRNKGNTKARIHSTCIGFDWDDDLKIVLDYKRDEDDPYILSPNGEMHFLKYLPSPPTKGEHFIEVCTCTLDSDEVFTNMYRTFSEDPRHMHAPSRNL